MDVAMMSVSDPRVVRCGLVLRKGLTLYRSELIGGRERNPPGDATAGTQPVSSEDHGLRQRL